MRKNSRDQTQRPFFAFLLQNTIFASTHVKMLPDAAVHTAFIEKIDSNHKEKRVQCQYCLDESKAKHTSRQRKHLLSCTAYLFHMQKNFLSNFITRSAAAIKSVAQTLLFPIISKAKREKLNRMTAMAVYCEGRPLSIFENAWMGDFFLKSVSYKPSEKNRLSEKLLDEAYMRTKTTMTKILKNSSLLNIVMNESDNQAGERILNMCVLTATGQSFHFISESVGSMQLNVRNEAN